MRFLRPPLRKFDVAPLELDHGLPEFRLRALPLNGCESLGINTAGIGPGLDYERQGDSGKFSRFCRATEIEYGFIDVFADPVQVPAALQSLFGALIGFESAVVTCRRQYLCIGFLSCGVRLVRLTKKVFARIVSQHCASQAHEGKNRGDEKSPHCGAKHLYLQPVYTTSRRAF